MLPKKIQEQINQLPSPIRSLVEGVVSFFKDLLGKKSEEILKLKKQLKEAEDKLAKNSRNSSKPPSSDGLNKPAPKSRREKTNRKPGGQEGHEGATLKMVDNPKHTKLHEAKTCQGCGADISALPAIDHRRRQVYDIPPIQIEVTEHQAEMKVCTCGCMTVADFPVGVDHVVQYGSRLKGSVCYLQNYQLLPYDRTREFIFDFFGHELSTGTLNNIGQKAYDRLESFEERLKMILTLSAVAGFDETGFRVMTKLHWLHSCSTNEYVYYQVHAKRGREAMGDIGILPDFEGVAVHDFWSSYYHYACQHGLCNAHILRELIFIHDRMDQQWAKELHDLLIKMNEAKKKAIAKGKTGLSTSTLGNYQKQYDQIVKRGLALNPFKPPDKKKRGRPAKGKARNLLERLQSKAHDILRFFYDFTVPFDNNFSERDLRMMKVKQKISGCFRSFSGAQRFARIRSYIMTARKQKVSVMDALNDLFEEQNIPFVLTANFQG